MRTKTSYLLVACIAIACCLAHFQPASQAAAYELDLDDLQSATLSPIEPVPDADDSVGEVSLSDLDSAAKSHASFPIDVPTRPVSLKSTVSLTSMADDDLAAGCDSTCYDSTCYDSTCDDCLYCGSCRPCVRRWVRADYLLWWTRGSKIPPLVTTSTDQGDNGILYEPTTQVLYGDSRDASDARSAPRITMGYWFDCCRNRGVQFDYFNLGQYNNNFDQYSGGSTLLARPIYSVLDQEQASELVAKDNVVEGRIRVDADDYFQSFGVLWRWNICCRQTCDDGCEDYCDDGCGGSCGSGYCGGRNRGSLRYIFHNLLKPAGRTAYRVDFIAGYRNYRLDDNIRITEDLTLLAPIGQVPEDTRFEVEDSFRATNEFHGGELGIITHICRGRWSLELLAKMALGNNSSIVDISGSTVITRPGDEPADYEAGLLALETNTGRYHQDQFVVIPQFGIELGYDLTCCLRAYCGYNFLYWAQVTRAAEQIDTNVNTSYIPPPDPSPPPAPLFSHQDSDFWAQGLNFGLEWQF